MAFSYSKLVNITSLPSTTGVLYANLALKTAYVRLIMLHNANTTAETVELWSVPNSGGSVGTPGDTNKIFKEVLNTGETRFIEYPTPGLMLDGTNDTLQGKTTTASKVTITVTGGIE